MEEIVAKAYQIIIRFADGKTMTFDKFIDGSNNICAQKLCLRKPRSNWSELNRERCRGILRSRNCQH